MKPIDAIWIPGNDMACSFPAGNGAYRFESAPPNLLCPLAIQFVLMAILAVYEPIAAVATGGMMHSGNKPYRPCSQCPANMHHREHVQTCERKRRQLTRSAKISTSNMRTFSCSTTPLSSFRTPPEFAHFRYGRK